MAIVRPAKFDGENSDADLCRTLMREYARFLNESVGGEHICVESLEEELAGLPGDYAEPAGGVLLAFDHEAPAGCVALKPLKLEHPTNGNENACEMKRLWVRPSQQGTGLGRALAAAIFDLARERGYTAMYLDTMPQSMQAAYRLYCSMGFTPVDRYNQNPVLRQTGDLDIAFLRKEL
jgi:GNAT superfamily N-acetyltransferase